MERRLAAVLISDVVGYTKRMEEDTEGTVAAWSDARDTIISPAITSREGRIVKFTGDGFLAEFKTVQTALECGIELQSKLVENSLEFRIAINLGDIIDDGVDIHGEGVNIAARLEEIAKPGGVVISGDVYNQVKNRIDAEYIDLGLQEVKNVAEPVQAFSVIGKDETNLADPDGKPHKSEKASLAVLHLNNMSGDPEQEYFCDGITEDLITSLSRLKFLRVVARNSTFAYKNTSPDIRKVAEELDVRYVVEGSIRKAGNTIRINVQLIEGETGGHLWAEKYDRDLEDIFEVQDEIVTKVTQEIFPSLKNAETSRALKLSPDQLGAQDAIWRALWHYDRHQDDDFGEAGKWADRAIELDPTLGLAWAIKGVAKGTEVVLGITKIKGDYLDMAKKAISLDPNDGLIRAFTGHIHMQNGDAALAIEEYTRALKINPNLHVAHFGLGWCLTWSDNYIEGREALLRAIELSPQDPLCGRTFFCIGMSYLGEKKLSDAKDWMDKAVNMVVQWPAHVSRASVYAHLGKVEEAKNILIKVGNDIPDISISFYKDRMPFSGDVVDYALEGLRLAGCPE